MTEEKLNWTELRKAVAERIDTPEKEVGQFLNALISTISEGLRDSGSVRINGLGTFTLKEVAPRKSVNVNTGEAILLDGYKKIGFAAEAAMKDLAQKINSTEIIDVNKRPEIEEPAEEIPATDATETNAEEDPLRKLGEQADEILGIIAELQGMDNANVNANVNVNVVGDQDEDVVGDQDKDVVVEVETPVVETIAETPVVEEQKEEEPTIEETKEEPVVEETKEEPKEEHYAFGGAYEEKQKESHPWRTILIILLIFSLLLAGLYFFAGYRFNQWVEKIHEEITKIMPAPADTITPTDIVDTTTVIAPAVPARDYSITITTEYLEPGYTLSMVAEKYYGRRELWVFLYEANRETIPSPNKVEVGTPIQIPALSSKWRNLDNPETKQTVDSLKQVFDALP